MLREFFAEAALWCCYGTIIVGMAWDLVAYRIPNIVSAIILCLFPVAAIAAGNHPDWVAHLGTGSALFGVGVVLLVFHWFGGGDVKFLAAIGTWIGLQHLPAYLAYVGLIGGALGMVLILVRRLLGSYVAMHAELDGRMPRLLRRESPVPYGLAIGAGALLVGLS